MRGLLLALGLGLLGLWLARLLRVGRSVARHADFWSTPRGDVGGLLYVALGDSAAQGIGASRPERGYVGLLAQRMRDRTGRPVQVVNLSRSGARLADLVEVQLPRLRELQPDVVTVAIGGNDVVAYDAARFSEQVCRLTAALPAGAVVADVPYFMHGHWERRASQTGQLLTECARTHGLTTVPLHDAERARGSVAMLIDFAADWFHPNDRGHQVWADAFWGPLSRTPALAVAPAGPDQGPGSRPGSRPATAPPLRWWLPMAATAVAATVLTGLVVAFGTNAGPLDDPDQAFAREGALHDGAQLAAQVGGVSFGGRTVVVLFERRVPEPEGLRSWRAEVTRGGNELVVAVAGQAGTSALQTAVGMRTPNDAGPPVGYAIVDPDRRVRYATLDPVYLEHASEVDLLVADATGSTS